jgi:hypothetical protein
MENEDLDLNEEIQQLEELWDWFSKKKQDRLIKKRTHPSKKPPTDLAKSVQKIKAPSPTYTKSDIEEPVDDVTGNLNNFVRSSTKLFDSDQDLIEVIKLISNDNKLEAIADKKEFFLLMKRYKVILDQMLKAIPALKKKAREFHAILPPIVQQKEELPLVKPELAQESLKEQLERIFKK